MNWNFFLRNFKMTHMVANDPRENVINKIKVIMISGGNPEIWVLFHFTTFSEPALLAPIFTDFC